MPKSRKAGRIEIINPHDQSFSRQAPQADSPVPKPQKVDSGEVIAVLRATGKGWTDDIRELLRLPAQLYMIRTGDGTFYSSDERLGILGIPAALGPEPLKAEKIDYGIALYSTGGSVYFILADMERRIIVRERMFCIHEKPPETDWTLVKEGIQSALSASESETARKQGLIAVFDRALKLVKMSS
ncbi:MAG: hypothetical protein AB1324_01520 [Candidatus Micrarchaeota archaeon]